MRPRTVEEVAAAVGLAAAAGLPSPCAAADTACARRRRPGRRPRRVHVGRRRRRRARHRRAAAPAGRTSPRSSHRTGSAISSGDTRDVGVGGLALGGGIGWFVRQQGLAVDALREVELVTAAGEVLTATADEHPDVFWALRGGGGNFGVVTRFVFQPIPGDGLVGGHVQFDASDVPAGAPRLARRDARRPRPAQLHAHRHAGVRPRDAGRAAARDRAPGRRRGRLRELLEPLLSLPSVTEVTLGPVAYGDLLEDAPPGRPPFQFVGGNGFVPDLSDEALDAFASVYCPRRADDGAAAWARRRVRSCRARRDRDRVPRRRGAAHRERGAAARCHARAAHGRQGGQRCGARVHQRHLRQLRPRARRRGHGRDVSAGNARPAPAHQGRARPRQRVPAEPQHRRRRAEGGLRRRAGPRAGRRRAA